MCVQTLEGWPGPQLVRFTKKARPQEPSFRNMDSGVGSARLSFDRIDRMSIDDDAGRFYCDSFCVSPGSDPVVDEVPCRGGGELCDGREDTPLDATFSFAVILCLSRAKFIFFISISNGHGKSAIENVSDDGTIQHPCV